MDENWDQHADGWDSNEDLILYSNKAYSTLCEIVDPKGLTILDFGCGTGLLTERMATRANHIVAIDSSYKMISVLRNKHLKNVDSLTATLSEEMIKTHDVFRVKFDLVVASSVCAFLKDYQSMLHLLKKTLKLNGIFVQWDWLKSDEDDGIGFSKERIKSAFQQAGLKVLSINEAFCIEGEHGSMKVIMGAATKKG